MAMQTLRLLGAGIIGRFEREDLPHEANPRGYYEDREILGHGLTEYAISAIEAFDGDAVAVKIALDAMIQRDRIDQWRYLVEKQAIILITARHPLEIALSKQVFDAPKTGMARFVQITSFLRDYQLQFKALAEILVTRVPELLSNLHIVMHRLAYDDPQGYIEVFDEILGAGISTERKTAARRNIDPSLYRYRLDSVEDEIKEWHSRIGASSVYDALAGLKNPWPVIHAMELKCRPDAG